MCCYFFVYWTLYVKYYNKTNKMVWLLKKYDIILRE